MKGKIKTKYWILIIVAILSILLLFVGAKEGGFRVWFPKAKTNVSELQTRIEKNHMIWAALIEDTAYSDLCSEVYAKRFEGVADEFIECYKDFDSLDEDETTMENYRQYQEYFTTYRDIGKTLYDFTDAIKESKYKEALNTLKQLRKLNQEIPMI